MPRQKTPHSHMVNPVLMQFVLNCPCLCFCLSMRMKINPTRPAQASSATARKKGASKTSFAPSQQTEQQATSSISAPSPISSVDALIALQGEEQVPTATQKATKRAHSLLGILDTIRLGLLEGGIPQSTLKRLLHALGEQREDTLDPKLEAILNQVEIRAQVELAKLETAVAPTKDIQ